MRAMRDVSVITVMRDEWDLAYRLGNSILWCEDWHIVVTDDGVTETELRALADRLLSTWGSRLSIHHYPIPLGDSFDAARASALPSVKNDWILVLDTDERVPESTLETIKDAISDASDDVGGFWFPRLNYVLTRPLFSPAYWPDWQLRLVRRTAVTFPDGIHNKYRVRGRSVHFEKSPEAAIHHFNFRSNDQFLKKIQKKLKIIVIRFWNIFFIKLVKLLFCLFLIEVDF